MAKKHGYTQDLLILPFDHRNSFQEKMFGVFGTPNAEQLKLISSYKTMIFEGFEKASSSTLPKENMGILVDEQFGAEVLSRAKKQQIPTAICAEKSGQDEFDFEFGENFKEHIEKIKPQFVKVLVRYNPNGDELMNERQTKRLVRLSQYLESTPFYFMFELLVPPTPEQLKKCNQDKATFDREVRPQLMATAIEQLQDAGVEPDVWKLEGLERTEDYQKIVETAHRDGRESVGIIVLGRGESAEKVKHWLKEGAKVDGVIGFAVGRTVFWEPLKMFRENKISKEQAVSHIADNYKQLCDLWIAARRA